MTTINSLYESFVLSPDCTDDELRRAYHHEVLRHHPDLNPDNVKTATAKTQQLTAAYATLRESRKHGVESLNLDAKVDFTATSGPVVWISFNDSVDIKDIARRKKSFRQAWEAFRKNPSDVLRGLRLVHATFEAERQDVIDDLLRNPILIDAAALLLHIFEKESACETLTKWACTLFYEKQMPEEGIQILEDAFSSGKAPNEMKKLLKEDLRSMHYGFAQGYTSRTRRKPAPAVRIEHFNRILELGFKYGYIYKFLAEAYHELGKDTQARIHLKRAYKIDPQLMGAVRISRALGFLPAKKTVPQRKKTRAKYKYTQPEHIPSPSQIQEWAASEN
ncbi:MAG: J domain-containing protein, partial [Euryarchaeota archaeon]|nr:J domain-containing protein [Euryarchaeota archaeon]